MFGSRLTEESLTEDFSTTSSGKTRRDDNHILENILDCDPDDEEGSAFIQDFLELSSIDVINGLITISSYNLRTIYSCLSREINFMSWHNVTGIKCLRRFLKRLQEKVHYKIRANLDYY